MLQPELDLHTERLVCFLFWAAIEAVDIGYKIDITCIAALVPEGIHLLSHVGAR